MNIEKYDFEGGLERGFKTLFEASNVALITADDIDLSIGNEAVTVQIDTGGPGSDEHLNSDGEYDTYTGSIDIEVRTLRVSNDQPTNSVFKNRHVELVANARQLLEEIGATEISTYWPDAHAPTKIKPTSTQREVDHEFRYTRLSYEMQFRIT